MLTNDNQPLDGVAAGHKPADGVAANHAPDPHGQAALLLVESLIHVLRERSVLRLEDTIDAVDTAISVQAEVTAQADGVAPVMRRALMLLQNIADSLQQEVLEADGRA